MNDNVKIAKELEKIAKMLVADCPAKNHVLEMCEEGILTWEAVARECIAEMSEDDVADMCRICEWDYNEDNDDDDDNDNDDDENEDK